MSGLRLKDGVHLNPGRDIPRRRHGVITEVEILTIYTTKSTHDYPPGVFSPVVGLAGQWWSQPDSTSRALW
jgi:hypothetical protein